MVARINRILGKKFQQNFAKNEDNTQIINQFGVGVVIPCYNEEDRLSSALFQNFIAKNIGCPLCFMNDGSTDDTISVLEKL